MRKRKLSSVGLAAILSVSLISGGIFAWFISQDTTAQVVIAAPKNGGGGKDIIIVDPLEPENPGEVDPGTPMPIGPEDKDKDPVIENRGDSPVVLELDLSSKSLMGMLKDGFNKAEAEDWLDEYDDVYTENDVVINDNTVKRYTFSQDRLKEVVVLKLDSSVNTDWVQGPDTEKYYTVVAPKGTVSLDGLSITVLGELGGMKLSQDGSSRSVSRQFEQKSAFRANLQITSMISHKDAIASEFGPDVLAALQARGFEILG